MDQIIEGRRDRPTTLDWLERLILFALWTGLLMRLEPTLAEHPYNLLLLISDGLIVGLVLFRRPTNCVSRQPVDFVLALAGTAAPLLAIAAGRPLAPNLVGAGLMALGLAVSFSAKLALWRSFGLVPANRGIKRGGPYRFVRHPMYLGYFITQVGFLLLNPAWTNCLIYAAAFGLQILRMKAEEAILGRDPLYAAYMGAVKYRLAPGLY